MNSRTRRQSRSAPARPPARSTPQPERVPNGSRPPPRVRLPDGTRSVQSPWVWRGYLFMSLIALGLCLTLALERRPLYATAWAFVTIGWFSIAMWLWRKHLAEDATAPIPHRGGRSR